MIKQESKLTHKSKSRRPRLGLLTLMVRRGVGKLVDEGGVERRWWPDYWWWTGGSSSCGGGLVAATSKGGCRDYGREGRERHVYDYVYLAKIDLKILVGWVLSSIK